jgi:hypothetical protein
MGLLFRGCLPANNLVSVRRNRRLYKTLLGSIAPGERRNPQKENEKC